MDIFATHYYRDPNFEEPQPIPEAIEHLQEEVEALQEHDAVQDAAINNLKNKLKNAYVDLSSTIIVGDSMVAGVHTGGNVRSWAYQLSDMLPDCTFRIRSQPGCGFKRSRDGKTISTLLSEVADGMDIDQQAAVSTVIMMAGYNDKDETDVTNSITATLNTAHSYYPNAQLVIAADPVPILFPHQVLRWYSYAIDFYNLTANRRAIFLEGSETWGVGRIGVGWFDTDNLHPNYEFHTLIANRIYEWCITGTPIISKWQENDNAMYGSDGLFTFTYDGKSISIDMFLNNVPTTYDNNQTKIIQLPLWLRENHYTSREWNPVICNNTGTVTANLQKKSDGYLYFQRSNYDQATYDYTLHLMYSAEAWF